MNTMNTLNINSANVKGQILDMMDMNAKFSVQMTPNAKDSVSRTPDLTIAEFTQFLPSAQMGVAGQRIAEKRENLSTMISYRAPTLDVLKRLMVILLEMSTLIHSQYN